MNTAPAFCMQGCLCTLSLIQVRGPLLSSAVLEYAHLLSFMTDLCFAATPKDSHAHVRKS